jgi:carbamate kinase
MLVVVALGGDVLLRPGDLVDADVHRATAGAAQTLAALAAEHHLVLTYAFGSHVGLSTLDVSPAMGCRPTRWRCSTAKVEAVRQFVDQGG